MKRDKDMTMTHRVLLLLSLLIIPVLSFAQTGVIQGKVIDAKSGKPLPSSTVMIKDHWIGTATDEDGYYSLPALDTGEYFIEVMFLGFENQTRKVILNKPDTLTIDFGLVHLPATLETIEIKAGDKHILKEPMPVTKIETQQIERLNATNTAEVLNEVSGVSVARAGNWGSKPYFQGLTDDRVLVFIDGIKVTQSCPMGMDACVATIEPGMISSMEVQVGPGNAQYGSGNMGGVININTLSSKYMFQENFTTDIEVSGRYQSVSNSRTGLMSIKGGNKIFDFAIGTGAGWHDNYRVPAEGDYTVFPKNEILFSGFNSRWHHLKARYRPAKGHQIALVSQIYRAYDIGWPSRMSNTQTIIPEEKRDMLGLNYVFERNGKHFRKLKVNAGYQSMFHNMENILPGNTRFIGLSETDNYQFSAKSFFTFGQRHLVTAGIDGWIWQMHAERQTVTNDQSTPFVPILNEGVLYETGFFVLDRFIVTDKLTIDAGLRLNYVQSDAKPAEEGILSNDLKDEQIVWTGNIAPVYRINKNLSIAGALVRGFNAATPVDRFISAPMMDGFYHYGNPSLKPETNFNKRIGVRGMFNKWNWNVEYFHNNVNNLIHRAIDTTLTSPVPGLQGVKRAKNISSGVITGLNAFAAYYAMPSLSLSLNAAYLYGFDREGKPLPFIAPFELTPKIAYEHQKKDFWVTLSANIATGQERYAPQFGEIHTPAYVVFDMGGGWKVSDWLELSAGVNNIANSNYRRHLNIAHLPEPGLNVFATAKVTLPLTGKKAYKPSLKEAQLVTFKIEGMACHFCVQTVRERTEVLPQVIQTIVYLKDGKAEVIADKNISLDELAETIRRAGFQVQFISVEPFNENAFYKENQ